MCPMCVTTTATNVAALVGISSAGTLTAFVAAKLRLHHRKEERNDVPQSDQGSGSDRAQDRNA